jgi:hypothetical protein
MEEAEPFEPFVKEDSPLRGYERGETVRPKVVSFFRALGSTLNMQEPTPMRELGQLDLKPVVQPPARTKPRNKGVKVMKPEPSGGNTLAKWHYTVRTPERENAEMLENPFR